MTVLEELSDELLNLLKIPICFKEYKKFIRYHAYELAEHCLKYELELSTEEEKDDRVDRNTMKVKILIGGLFDESDIGNSQFFAYHGYDIDGKELVKSEAILDVSFRSVRGVTLDKILSVNIFFHDNEEDVRDLKALIDRIRVVNFSNHSKFLEWFKENKKLEDFTETNIKTT